MAQLRGSMGRRRALAALAAAGLVAGTSLAAGAATSATAAAPTFPVTSFLISTSNVTVHSSTHTKLTYFAVISSDTKTGGLEVGLSNRHGENHDWDFRLTRAAIHISPDKGTGHVNTRTQLKGFGHFTVTVSSAGKARKSCPASTGYTTNRKVRLTGTPTFNSKSGKHGWGIVGAHRMTMTATLTVEHGSPSGTCGRPTPHFCPSAGISLDDFAGNADVNAFTPSGKATQLFAFREVNLRSPKHASRTDEVQAKGIALKAKKAAGGHLSFLIKGASKHVTGTARVTTTSPASASSCRAVSSRGYFGSKWVNGSKKLTFHGQIENGISEPNNTNADVQVTRKR